MHNFLDQANRLTPGPSLTASLIRHLTEAIEAGRLSIGDRLPTESQLMRAFGVSRTVVREAVAGLRAAGLVTTRQGLGAFVAARASVRHFRILPEELGSLDRVLHILELRAAVEPEAAALVAMRGGQEATGQIEDAQARFEAAIAAGDPGFEEDNAFHREIAAATGNPLFANIIASLGNELVPRREIPRNEQPSPIWRRNVAAVAAEHRRILEAIRSGDAAGARRDMRRHLAGSRRRMLAASRSAG
jgi:DNA-binding FadR family transcriptional regulator